jgi:hypothetical protein
MFAPRTSAEPAKTAAAPLRPAQPFFKPAPVRQAAPARQPTAPTVAAPGPDLLSWLPDSLRAAASDHAHHFRGFPLLTVLLGLDPFTHQAVARTPDTLVHGLLALTPDGEAQYEHLKKAGALPKAFNWLSTEADRRHLSWSAVRGMLTTAWRSFSGTDLLLHPVDTLTRLAEPFRHLAAEAAGFAGAVTEQVLEFVFSSVLGPDAARVLAVLKRAGAAFRLVLRDPVRFAGHLAWAATQGFAQFRAHAAQHLQQGLAGWLLGGPLAGLGLRLPARLDGPGLLSLGLQTLGLTYDYLRAKLVARVGAAAVARLEQSLGLLRTLLTQGLGAAAGQLAELASSLPELVLNQLEAWVSRTVLTQALLKLGTLLVPGGAVVEAVRGVYHTVQFFLERGQQLGAVVSTFLDALGTIAAGGVAAAATRLEQTMGRLVPLVLAFLARLTGMGDIGQPIQALLRQLRRPLEAALEKLVGIILKLGQRLLASPAKATPAGTALTAAVPANTAPPANKAAALRQPFAVGPEQHTLFIEQRETGARLMLASDPQSYHQFILRLPDDPALLPVKKQAATLAQRIDGLLAQTRGPYGRDRTAAIAALLTQLAPLTMELLAHGGGTVLADTPPEFGGLTAGGFGRGMRIAYLATKTSTGTEASAAGNAVFDVLNQRRSGNGSYYVRGHLLSSAHHGTGADWRNLTPLSRSGNGLHETRVESRLWQAISNPPTRAFLYSVMPVYGRGVQRDLLQQLARSADPAKATKAAIITAEQHVPLSLVCIIQEVEPLTRRPKGAAVQITVPNLIEQTAITDYQTEMTIQPLALSLANIAQLEALMIPEVQAAEIFKKTSNGVVFRNREHLLSEINGLSKVLVDSLYISDRIAFK